MGWEAILAGAVTAVAGTAATAVSAVESYKQQNLNADAAAAQARYNQRLAEQDAVRQETAAAEEVRRERLAAADERSRRLTLLGASGAALSSGSPLAVMGEAARREEQAIQETGIKGYNAAQQYRAKAAMYDWQAGVANASRPSAATVAGEIGAGALRSAASGWSIGASVDSGLTARNELAAAKAAAAKTVVPAARTPRLATQAEIMDPHYGKR